MILSLTLCLTLLGAAPATADDAEAKKQARALYEAGNALFAKHRYADALAKFQQTWAVRPHPSVQFNIGKCEEQLGDAPKALRAYRDYLRLAPTATDREEVFASIARLERSLREKGLQQLSVTADQPDARVMVDELELGAAPATTALPVGTHRLRVVADGFETLDRSVVLDLVQPVEIAAALQPKAPPPPVVSVEPELAKFPVRAPEPMVLTPAAVPQPRVVASSSASPRVWTWVVGGLALASAATGGVLLGTAYANANPTVLNANTARTREQANALYQGVQSPWLASTVAFGVAGAAAIAAIILFFVEQ